MQHRRSRMADAERCDMLAYLIEMAYVEVGDIIRGARPPRIADLPETLDVGVDEGNGAA